MCDIVLIKYVMSVLCLVNTNKRKFSNETFLERETERHSDTGTKKGTDREAVT
jgi:hypothetical protein